jgi:glutaredoxin 3
MPKVTIYTTEFCGYCEAAKNLLKSKGIAFSETLVKREDSEKRGELLKKSGMKTFPQIFNQDQLIGGYTELVALEESQGLDSLKD